ncbi:MAG: hypothetical protein OEM03_03690 [Chromatiales bacterium]|nr:hypothetical protein [Chromatiales bacterium]
MTGLSLNELAAFAEIIGACTIITGLAFGYFQIRAHRIEQRNAIALSVAQTFNNSEFARAVNLLQQLPDGASAQELSALGRNFEDAAVIVTTSFETMGLFVYRKIAEQDLVMDMAGGMCISMFRKLSDSIYAKRKDLGQPSWAEWFEWLALLAEKNKLQISSVEDSLKQWQST